MNDDITKLRNENIPAFHRSLKEGMYSSREIGRELFRSALNWINGLEKVASDAITRAENAEAEVERAEAKAHEFESEAIHNGEIMLSLAAEVAALKARVAALEAADQWHPGSEIPPDGCYQTYDKNGFGYDTCINGRWSWCDDHTPEWWREFPPLPTPPQEAPAA